MLFPSHIFPERKFESSAFKEKVDVLPHLDIQIQVGPQLPREHQ
jgi:hypothetical protein